MYLKCKECGNMFYLARLSSAILPEYIGCYERITSESLEKFFDEHGHDKANGEQYELYYQ